MTSELLAQVRLAMYDAANEDAAPDVRRMMGIWHAEARLTTYDVRRVARDCIRGYLGGGGVPLWERLERGWIGVGEALVWASAHPDEAAWLSERVALGAEGVRWEGPEAVGWSFEGLGLGRDGAWRRLMASADRLVRALPRPSRGVVELMASLRELHPDRPLLGDDAYAMERFWHVQRLVELMWDVYFGLCDCCWGGVVMHLETQPDPGVYVPMALAEYHTGRLLALLGSWAGYREPVGDDDSIVSRRTGGEAHMMAQAAALIANASLCIERAAERDASWDVPEARVHHEAEAWARAWLVEALAELARGDEALDRAA